MLGFSIHQRQTVLATRSLEADIQLIIILLDPHSLLAPLSVDLKGQHTKKAALKHNLTAIRSSYDISSFCVCTAPGGQFHSMAHKRTGMFKCPSGRACVNSPLEAFFLDNFLSMWPQNIRLNACISSGS